MKTKPIKDPGKTNILILANGHYGNVEWYRPRISGFTKIICADGGAGMACRLGIVPDLVVGDMDSIDSKDREALKGSGAEFLIYPKEKDLSDIQIAFEHALSLKATSVTLWGGTGSRLDHTFSTMLNAFHLVENNIDVCLDSPEVTIHPVRGTLKLSGKPDDTVSLIAIGDTATGVNLKGLYYPLNNATIQSTWQFGISNIMTGEKAVIKVKTGHVVVFHYHILTG